MAVLKQFKVFYAFQESGRQVPADAPVEMLEADIYSELLGEFERDRDFIGLIDSAGVTLQVLYEADHDQYWVELPEPAMSGSHGRYFSFDELADLLRNLPECFTISAFPGLEFQSWA